MVVGVCDVVADGVDEEQGVDVVGADEASECQAPALLQFGPGVGEGKGSSLGLDWERVAGRKRRPGHGKGAERTAVE